MSQELHTLSERAYTKCYFSEVGKVNVVHKLQLYCHGQSALPWETTDRRQSRMRLSAMGKCPIKRTHLFDVSIIKTS